jgi:Rps23 Pro-64 3,4-dihydroxylase Tpa1-like proline 4-hydroxylase
MDGPSQDELVESILARINEERARIVDDYRHPVGTPTRHFVVDDLLPPSVAQQIAAVFPRDASGFHNRKSMREQKKTSADLSQYDPLLGRVTYAIQDPKVVGLIADLTGIRTLEPDPLLYAGGLSLMSHGDFLNPHVDNSHDARRSRYRRLNLLYYVSPDWTAENGGNFELWDDSRTTAKTIVSRFNRLVVMETNRTSWHSVSKVVADRSRCCVSNYFFSTQSPDGDEYFHVTSFDARPEEPLKHVVLKADSIARNIVGKVLKVGRGKALVNKTPKDE